MNRFSESTLFGELIQKNRVVHRYQVRTWSRGRENRAIAVRMGGLVRAVTVTASVPPFTGIVSDIGV